MARLSARQYAHRIGVSASYVMDRTREFLSRFTFPRRRLAPIPADLRDLVPAQLRLARAGLRMQAMSRMPPSFNTDPITVPLR
jgi:hypothetical protein